MELIKKYIILPTHSLGQNFLVDDAAGIRIVHSAGIKPQDVVLEIGSGLGALTEHLCDQASFVHAVEIDKHLLDALQETLNGRQNVTVICHDFCKLSPKMLLKDGKKATIVVSNLPYCVMTPIMMKLFREWDDVKTMVFTVEEAACDRIFASPGNKHYGPLSIISSLFGTKEVLFELDSKMFHPTPHTRSAVIRLKNIGILHSAPSVLFPLVQAAFAQRRKTLLNTLSTSGLFPDGKKQVKDLLLSVDISPTTRAEQLVPEDFVKIAHQLIHSKSKSTG